MNTKDVLSSLLSLDVVARGVFCVEPMGLLYLAGYVGVVPETVWRLDTQSAYTLRRPDCVLRFPVEGVGVHVLVAEFQRVADKGMWARMTQNYAAVLTEASQRGERGLRVDLVEVRLKHVAREVERIILVGSEGQGQSWRVINTLADARTRPPLVPDRYPATFALWRGHTSQSLAEHARMVAESECIANKDAVQLLILWVGRARLGVEVLPMNLAQKKKAAMDISSLMLLPREERDAIIEAETARDLADATRRGFVEGKRKGFSEGKRKGFSEGKRKGFSDGESKGFSDGESKGRAALLETLSWVVTPAQHAELSSIDELEAIQARAKAMLKGSV